MCYEKGSINIKIALLNQIGDSLANGRDPSKARQVALDMIFNDVDILDADILMRLK